ncbi:V-type proton ATPase subunit C [Selaginella moellendorffii]|uniref:V-type proton ATPase subunit C n=1 Tax=Selaginella moellendorffii TaxID=88036 RepID=UPI000D1D0997|nr:V-type proton ATPase subunit C [Selaginella moellendorffii]|eukprot:XP_024522392.1 V-type proton ATPase subunit C [Selaginella moellendorffii]
MALAVTRYCLVSLPVLESAAATWAALQQGISRVAFDTPTYKINGVVEGVTHKIRRQIEDLDHHAGVEASALTVDGIYVGRGEIRVAEYTNVKTQLSAINRRQTGRSVAVIRAGKTEFLVLCSMAARDISNLVKPSDVISTEHLVTLVVVVSKFSQNEWLKSYESLTDFVVRQRALTDKILIKTFQVPRSSAKLHEDNEYALYTVILFRKVADNFKSAARERGFQVFSAWMHICAIRIFAESILRYGLPPNGFWKSDEDGGGVAGIVGGEVEAHPYVSFTLNLAG